MSFSNYLEEYSYTTITERRIFEDGLSLYNTSHRTQQGAYFRQRNTLGTSLDSGKALAYDVGVLSKLLVMPVDIFCEIAAHLEPYDVLNLARSTRDLNAFLMSKESQPVWRTARSYYPAMPDCPSDLSEPEYSRLLFETDTCHACLEPRETRPYFAARARLCDVCSTTAILKYVELIRIFPELGGRRKELLQCVPCHTHTTPKYRDLKDEAFYVPRVALILKRFNQFCQKSDVPLSLSGCNDYDTRMRYWSALDEFMNICLPVAMDVVVKQAASMDQWCVTYKQIKAMEITTSVERHQLLIRKKLIALGHNPKDFPGDWDAEWEDIMSNPQTYSSDRWKSILHTLEECIYRERERREAEERETRQAAREREIVTFLSSFKSKPAWLNRAELLLLPTVNAMYCYNDYNRPITVDLWDAKVSEIEKDIEAYHQEILDILVSKTESSSHSVARDDFTRILEAPGTFFRCTCCSEALLRYPSLLSHNKYSPTQRIVKNYVEFNAAASNIAQMLLVSMGLEFNQDISYVNSQFQCTRCDSVPKPMSWTELVRHYIREQDRTKLRKQSYRFGPKDDDREQDHSFNDTLPAIVLSCEEVVEMLGDADTLANMQEHAAVMELL